MLISIADNQCLSDDQLHTFLLEAESIMNSRPLLFLFTLDVDSHEALTPNPLLKLHPAVELPPTLATKNDFYARSRWRHVQYLADKFWRRFSKKYLQKITTRQKWLNKKPNLKLDDVVLMCDETSPRAQWNLGRVITVHPDEHRKVRSVSVKSKGTELRRPIHKLCLLVPSSKDNEEEDLSN